MKHMSFVLIALAALALIVAGCDREITGDVALADQSASNCFDCHSDQDFDLLHAQDQFVESQHFAHPTVERNRLNSSNYRTCERCHTHEGFLANVDGIEIEGDHFSEFNCFTCHEPHSTGSLQVRVQEAVSLANGATYDKGTSNVCASCHQSRANVNAVITNSTALSQRFGPHYSQQSDMLLGTNGYEYDGYTYDSSPHYAVTDDGCVNCHMADKNRWADVGGHTFSMYDDEEDVQNVFACNQVGCHSSSAFESFDPVFPAGIDYDWDGESEGVQSEIHGLLDSLAAVLTTAGLLDETLHPVSITVGADTAGAVFNFLFVEEDQSAGIHNTQYAVDLLQSSINYMVHGDPNGNGGPTVPGRPSIYSAH